MAMQKTIKIDVTTAKTLWPYETVNVIQQVMEQGEADGKRGWEEKNAETHIDHAVDHLMVVLGGDEDGDGEDHLAHAFTRIMMAIAVRDGYAKGGGDNG